MTVAVAGPSSRHRDSPRVRRLAREAGVDLSTVRPTGAHGRATPLDVAAAARASSRAPRAAAPGVVSGVGLEVDLTRVLRAAGDPPGDAGSSLASLEVARVLRAAVEALLADPRLVGPGRSGAGVRVGVVRDPGEPIILRDVADLTAEGIARQLDAPRGDEARDSASDRPADLMIFDGSSLGVQVHLPVVLPGSGAVLAIGAPVRRPVIVDVDGQEVLAIRSVAGLTLTFDEQSVARPAAAAFLDSVRRRLEAHA